MSIPEVNSPNLAPLQEDQANSLEYEINPIVRVGSFVVALALIGSFGGAVCYCIFRLADKQGLLGSFGGNALRLKSFALGGIATLSTMHIAIKAYEVSLKILGERNVYENLTYSENTSACDRFRQLAWKVIGFTEISVRRAQRIFLSLMEGSFSGGIFYLATLVLVRVKFIETFGKIVQPSGYILSGICSKAIVEVARLIHDISLFVLGERKIDENLVSLDNASIFDRLRQYVWKVNGWIEQLVSNIDSVYSRIFYIRTTKEIQEEGIPGADLDNMEILRRAVVEQIYETKNQAIPFQLGIYCVKNLGYSIFGVYVMMNQCLGFVTGIQFKCNLILSENIELYLLKNKEIFEKIDNRKINLEDPSNPFIVIQGSALTRRLRLYKKYCMIRRRKPAILPERRLYCVTKPFQE